MQKAPRDELVHRKFSLYKFEIHIFVTFSEAVLEMPPLLRISLKFRELTRQGVMELLEDFFFGKVLVDLGLFQDFYDLWLDEVQRQLSAIAPRTVLEQAILRSNFVAGINFLVIWMVGADVGLCLVIMFTLNRIRMTNCRPTHGRFLTLYSWSLPHISEIKRYGILLLGQRFPLFES